MAQATLTTSRLSMVPLAPEHLEHAVELDSDPEVMRYLSQGPSSRETIERAHRRRLEIARRAPGLGLWVGSTDGEFVGWWLLRPREPVPVEGEVEMGYRLMRRSWRRGLAAEGARELIRHAFEDLGFSRVFAEAMAVNTASRATMASVGLRYVRSFHPERDGSRIGAEFGDVEYALTRDAWFHQRTTTSQGSCATQARRDQERR
jgi:RimJ/RimL family protein N-acetyltransferase